MHQDDAIIFDFLEFGGLFLERPLYYDNYAAGDLYRNFKSISNINRTEKSLQQIIALDLVLAVCLSPSSFYPHFFQ